MSRETFNYENIANKEGPKIHFDRELNYEAFRGTNFITLRHIVPHETVNEGTPKHGWKFHISIDDEDPENLSKGWNIIKEQLITHNIHLSKVVCLDQPMSEYNVDGHSQAGKQITIYAFYQLDLAWQNILQEMETALNQGGIVPSIHAEGDRAIPGSQYFSYRHDGDLEENYVRNAGEYNPYRHDDPFFNIVVNVANPIPEQRPRRCCGCQPS